MLDRRLELVFLERSKMATARSLHFRRAARGRLLIEVDADQAANAASASLPSSSGVGICGHGSSNMPGPSQQPVRPQPDAAADSTADFASTVFPFRSVDDEPRRDIGDALDFDQVIGLQRGTAGDQVDNAAAQT